MSEPSKTTEYAVFKFEYPNTLGIHKWLAEKNLDAYIKVKLMLNLMSFWRVKIGNKHTYIIDTSKPEYMVVQLGDEPDVRFYDEEEFNQVFKNRDVE